MTILLQPFLISQPGSPVATSLCEGESLQKHVGILNIRPDNKVSEGDTETSWSVNNTLFGFQVQNGRDSSTLGSAPDLQDNLRD